MSRSEASAAGPLIVPLDPIAQDLYARKQWLARDFGVAISILWPLLTALQGFALGFLGVPSAACSLSVESYFLDALLVFTGLALSLTVTMTALHLSLIVTRHSRHLHIAIGTTAVALVAIGLSIGLISMVIAFSPETASGVEGPARILIGTLPFWPGVFGLLLLTGVRALRPVLQRFTRSWILVGVASTAAITTFLCLAFGIASAGCR